jgi:hypothetical protein
LGSSSYRWRDIYLAKTSGSILFSDGSKIAEDNANLFWDNTNKRLGVGTTKPRAKMDVLGMIIGNGLVDASGLNDYAQSASVSITAGTLYGGGPTVKNGRGFWETSTFPSSITLDFGTQISDIAGIGFNSYWARDYRWIPRDYAIDYSSDGTTWTNLVTVTGNVRADVFHTCGLDYVRYIRITVNAPQSGQSICRISAIQVLSAAPVPANRGPFSLTWGGDAIFIGGNVGIGTTAPQAYLDVIGSNAGTRSLLLRSGDTSDAPADSMQIIFGYNGRLAYPHNIRTRHNSGAAIGNAIDFYIWNYGVDAVDTPGTKHVMTLEGTGNVGIGTTSPAEKLHVIGNVRIDDAYKLVWSDTNLYRGAADVLKTDDNFDALALRIGGTTVIDSSRKLQNIASIVQTLLPNADNTYDLGSSTYRWRNLLLSGYAMLSSIQNLSGQTVLEFG